MGRRRKSSYICMIELVIVIAIFGIISKVLLAIGGVFTNFLGGTDDMTDFIVGVFIISVAIILFTIEKRKRINVRNMALRMEDIDCMSGIEFENYICWLLRSAGCDAEVTKASGDFGVDIIAKDDKVKYAIQVKRHNKNVSRRAVSDAVAGAAHYGCNAAMVITNSYFSRGAIELARSTGCILIDRDRLAQWIADLQSVSKI